MSGQADRARLGRRGEIKARRFLWRRGLRTLAANWRHPSGGELDLVMRDGDVLVIVEVRTARKVFAGGPAQTVGPEKQRRLARLAQLYLARAPFTPRGVRFDVVGVVHRGLLRWEITWYRDAFQVGS
ncbi:MAG: YraN family protein [Myxococcales bacterium]|nr:YraN family protein [Myxococcales bacterium]MCB9733044.1 YraN family protein [Deltaproteobacteria bacterium]